MSGSQVPLTAVDGTPRPHKPTDLARLARWRPRYVRAEEVRLLDCPEEIFPRVLAALEEARERILIECYWFQDDALGSRIAEVLRRRARAGVDVSILFDSVGSITTSRRFWATLREAGAHVVEYHPVALWRSLGTLNRRDHRKLVSVDAEVVFVGGMNFCDANAPIAWGGFGWCDAALEIRGAKAAARFDHVFLRTWARLNGAPLREVRPRVAPGRAPGPRVAALANRLIRERLLIRHAYLHAIRRARRYVWIANPYFIPDGNVRRTLIRTARRGIDVRVLVPRRSDNRLTDAASRGLHGKLLRGGVKLYAYDGPMLHAKTIVVDGTWGTVGSYNLDNRSLRFNLELAAAVIDRRVGESMRRTFERDLASASAITLDDWERRSWADRLMERGASLLSAYL
jgi:cardiolipin synthase